jgi:hypothetical protein
LPGRPADLVCCDESYCPEEHEAVGDPTLTAIAVTVPAACRHLKAT